jgi:hypothetical protein
MYRNIIVMLIVAGTGFLFSCQNNGAQEDNNNTSASNRILQQSDGTIALKVDKAACYSDQDNPSSNTAEWDVIVSKSGRYDVWLSSATKDTTSLHYQNSVKLNFQDNRLEARPECDKVIHGARDVTYPYFKADSFLGSMYIRDPGEYSVQVISDGILPADNSARNTENVSTRMLAVLLKPITQ